MEDLKYKSKTDLWVYIVIIGSCAAMLPLLFLKPFSWVVFFIVAGICLFMLDMLFNTHYIIKGDVLVISPKDKDAFIRRLLEVNNNIIVAIK
jgi:hypothetical protein